MFPQRESVAGCLTSPTGEVFYAWFCVLSLSCLLILFTELIGTHMLSSFLLRKL